jgi:beta-N-acetylhexosaminidase
VAQAKAAKLAPPLVLVDPHGLGGTPRTAAAAKAAGDALRRAGVGAVLGPSADVSVPDGPLDSVALGQEPGAVARTAAAVAGAYARAGVRSVPGQFPGAGTANVDPDQGQATVGDSRDDLRKRDLVPFRRVAPTVKAIQLTNASYAAFDGVSPADLLPDIATGLLRRDVRFAGAAVSPDLGATQQAANEPMGQVAVEALRAGCDLLYLSGPPADQRAAYTAVLKAASSGRISAGRLNAALGRAVAFTQGR